MTVRVLSLPGTFCTPDKILAYVWLEDPNTETTLDDAVIEKVSSAFVVGRQRTFVDDPRFGLIVLSEIASKALSPAVNDPGTAITIIGSLVRLLGDWGAQSEQNPVVNYDRVEVPELSSRDLFDDAFTAIARDGSALVEVAIRLQKALQSLAVTGDKSMRSSAHDHARMALLRAETALDFEDEKLAVRAAVSDG
jgi:uncharacterized membrane protein